MSMQISRVKGVKYHGHLAMCKYIVDSCCLLPGSPTKEINYRLMFGSTGVALQRWSINQDVTCRFLILKIKSYRIKFISLDFRVLFFPSQLHVRLQRLQRRQLPRKCLRYLARNARRTKTKKRWAGDFRVFLGVSACRGRWTWLKGSNMLHPIEANIEKKLCDVSVLLPTSWRIITIFGVTRWSCFFSKDFSGSKQGWFFVWSWGSCFGSFRACGGAVGWTGKASCWKARKKMTNMTKHVRREGLRRKLTEA